MVAVGTPILPLCCRVTYYKQQAVPTRAAFLLLREVFCSWGKSGVCDKTGCWGKAKRPSEFICVLFKPTVSLFTYAAGRGHQLYLVPSASFFRIQAQVVRLSTSRLLLQNYRHHHHHHQSNRTLGQAEIVFTATTKGLGHKLE